MRGDRLQEKEAKACFGKKKKKQRENIKLKTNLYKDALNVR